MTRDCIVVVAADALFFDLCRGCIQSVRDKPEGRRVAFGLFDLGFTEEQLVWLRGMVDFIQQPDWDLSFPSRPSVPGYLRGLLARPFLRRYFPGHEIYLWVDADTWVQDWRAVDLFFEGARRRRGLAIVPEVDRGHQMQFGGLPKHWKQVQGWYEMAYGPEIAQQLHSYPMLNAGVFALHKDAPHWNMWEHTLRDALQRTASNVTDQVALNYAVYGGGLFDQTELLPAWCNWTSHSGLPLWDVERGCLVEPYLPHVPIGILHLTARKLQQHRLRTTTGSEIDIRLRYPAGPAASASANPADPTTIPQSLTVAVQHHEAGRLQAAEQAYRQFLAIEPNHAGAWHLLGVLSAQCGNHQRAVEYLHRALAVKPDWADAQSNLGNVFRQQGNLGEAIACYRRAIQLKPDFAEARDSLDAALRDQAQLEEMVAQAIQHHQAGRLPEAERIYRQILAVDPNNANACHLMGIVSAQTGHHQQAVEFIQRALAVKPDWADALSNLGKIFREQGKLDQAIACYRRALDLTPDFALAHHNLGVVLQDRGQIAEAMACHRRAIELKPDFADAYNSLAGALREQGELAEAVVYYRRALELKPDGLACLCDYVHALQRLCCWEDVEALARRVVEVVDQDKSGEFAFPPFPFLALPTITSAVQQLRCARQWVHRQTKSFNWPEPGMFPKRAAVAKSKLTIGYLSADFRSHAIAYTIAELFEKHDRGRFEILGYSLGPDDGSAMRRRIVNGFDRFSDFRETSSQEAARRIAADGVDVLVDLMGYTGNARPQILSQRPAPIQVNFLGYTGSMAAPFIDYIVVDDFIVPPDQQPFFTERLVHVPGSYQVNDSQREIAASTPSRAECGLPETGFVFCSFNNSYKITPAMFSVWMRLLQAKPGSTLWLAEANRWVSENLRREAEVRGVSGERLVFAPRIAVPDHLARHRHADLFLDSFPYNAHTTSSDALWAGCPVLTLSGQTFSSRVAGSLLRTVGLPELITASLADYEALALRLSQDKEMLNALRARLKANRQTTRLFDAVRFARSIEQAFVTMHEIHTAGEQPRPFAV